VVFEKKQDIQVQKSGTFLMETIEVIL